MAKKREIFKVDEDALKDMMASESISCGKSGTDVGENVLPVTEKEKNVPEVKKVSASTTCVAGVKRPMCMPMSKTRFRTNIPTSTLHSSVSPYQAMKSMPDLVSNRHRTGTSTCRNKVTYLITLNK